MFLIPLSTLEYPLIFEIHLKFCQKQYNSLIKTVENFHILVIYKNGKILTKGCQAHLTTLPPYGYDLSNFPAVHRDLKPEILVFFFYIRISKKRQAFFKEILTQIRGFELETRGFELVTRGFALVTRGFALLARGYELAFKISTRTFMFSTRAFKLSTRNS